MDEENILNTTFDTLNLNDDLLRGIYSYGFENPSKIQGCSIPVIISNKDLIAQAQSGTGKTGAFLIGALQKINPDEKNTQILVIAPTHELVHQIYDVAKDLSRYLNIRIMEVVGGTNIFDCRKELDSFPHMIIGSPGRVLDMISKNFLYTNNIKTLIFDEADETLSYGFKETVYNIVKTIPESSQICLFSATIPEDIIELSKNFMNNPEQILY